MKATRNKQGYSLVEVVIVMALASIITAMVVKGSLASVKEYTASVERCMNEDGIDNAMLNIDRLVNTALINKISCDEEQDKIEIQYINDINSEYFNKKTILKVGNRLKVVTENNIDGIKTKGENILLDNVGAFEVYKKDQLIYFKIEMESGEERIRCI